MLPCIEFTTTTRTAACTKYGQTLLPTVPKRLNRKPALALKATPPTMLRCNWCPRGKENGPQAGDQGWIEEHIRPTNLPRFDLHCCFLSLRSTSLQPPHAHPTPSSATSVLMHVRISSCETHVWHSVNVHSVGHGLLNQRSFKPAKKLSALARSQLLLIDRVSTGK